MTHKAKFPTLRPTKSDLINSTINQLLHHIYILTPSDTEGIHLKRLHGMEKVRTLINPTYRLQFLEGLGMKTSHFEQSVSVAKHASVSRVTRPSGQFLLDELVTLLEKDFLDKDFRQD